MHLTGHSMAAFCMQPCLWPSHPSPGPLQWPPPRTFSLTCSPPFLYNDPFEMQECALQPSVALRCLHSKSGLLQRHLALQGPASVRLLDAPATGHVLPLLAFLLTPLSFQGSVPASLMIATSSLCPQEALSIPTSVSPAHRHH